MFSLDKTAMFSNKTAMFYNIGATSTHSISFQENAL